MRRIPALLVLAASLSCDWPTETTITVYECFVAGDTIHVPNDTTGVRCEDLPPTDTLPPPPAS